MERALNPLAVGERLDQLPVTLLHCLAIGLCALGFGFDLLEIALGSILSAVFSAPPHAGAPAQLSLLLSAVYVGAVIGAPLLGWLADRHGRRLTLMGALLLLAVASVGAAASDGVGTLTVWRGVAGLALGAYPPLMIAYLTDLLPAGRRGMLVFCTIAIGTLGPTLGIFAVRALVPLQPFGIEAWRWGFIIGGSGAAVVGLLFRLLPESPRWLQARSKTDEAQTACLRFERSPMVLAPGPAPMTAPRAATQLPAAGWRRWPLVAALFFLSPWSTVAFPLLTGAILTQKGFKLSDTLLFVGLSMAGPLVGTLLAALVVDRVGRRIALVICSGVMVVSGYAFVEGSTAIWLIVTSFVFMLFVSLFVSILNLYGAELFATSQRATSLAGAWAFNRLGAALAPLLLLPLLRSGGPATMFSVIAVSLVASVVLLTIAPPGRARHAVE